MGGVRPVEFGGHEGVCVGGWGFPGEVVRVGPVEVAGWVVVEIAEGVGGGGDLGLGHCCGYCCC